MLDFGSLSGQKKSRMTGRVKEGRKGLPLPATGDEKGAFASRYSNPRANSWTKAQAIDFNNVFSKRRNEGGWRKCAHYAHYSGLPSNVRTNYTALRRKGSLGKGSLNIRYFI